MVFVITHTILFTYRFQNTACRLLKFRRTKSYNAQLSVFVAKKQGKQILVTVWIKLYVLTPLSTETASFDSQTG